jgi:hypothetical protein
MFQNIHDERSLQTHVTKVRCTGTHCNTAFIATEATACTHVDIAILFPHNHHPRWSTCPNGKPLYWNPSQRTPGQAPVARSYRRKEKKTSFTNRCSDKCCLVCRMRWKPGLPIGGRVQEAATPPAHTAGTAAVFVSPCIQLRCRGKCSHHLPISCWWIWVDVLPFACTKRITLPTLYLSKYSFSLLFWFGCQVRACTELVRSYNTTYQPAYCW